MYSVKSVPKRRMLFLLCTLRLHVGVDVLHVVEVLKFLNHLVDSGTRVSVNILKVNFFSSKTGSC